MKFDLSEIVEVIRNRRTIKPEDFSTRQVHKEMLEKMLECARWAPTHGLTQPWHFTVFREEGLNKLSKFHADLYKQSTSATTFLQAKHDQIANRPLSSSAAVAIGMKRQEIEKIPELEEIEAVACAVQNMMLCATAYGLGTYWATGGMTYSDEFKSFLQLGEKDRLLGILYVGYPAIDWPQSQRQPMEYHTTWIEEWFTTLRIDWS